MHSLKKNEVAVNEIILTEVIPSLQVRNYLKLIKKLYAIHNFPLQIHWETIREHQVKCIQSGLSGIGIPDLLIAQNAVQNQCKLYTMDKHFIMMSAILNLQLYLKR